ncbi:hypothetical protein QUF90_10770 [Desulfococcaceae bacterium HSG9]|nr:hypothetical protein [Desulfococcaceae bacterium HSG9]
MSDEVEFEVGQMYENVKGKYEVLSISDDAMTIQWETGEQTSTTVSFQQRIIERIKFEKELIEEQKAKALRKGQKAYISKAGEQFKGLAESDFKTTISGTKWRNRSCLGGAVTKRLAPHKLQINSWAVPRKTAIQWQDIGHHRLAAKMTQAKFSALIDHTDLSYGFYIERGDQDSETSSDWNAFIAWLKKENNEAFLNKLVIEHHLRIDHQSGKSAIAQIDAHDGKWNVKKISHEEGEKEDIGALADFFDKIPASAALNLRIHQKTAKAEILARGEEIADDIAALFDVLMPLYEASATLVPPDEAGV